MTMEQPEIDYKKAFDTYFPIVEKAKNIIVFFNTKLNGSVRIVPDQISQLGIALIEFSKKDCTEKDKKAFDNLYPLIQKCKDLLCLFNGQLDGIFRISSECIFILQQTIIEAEKIYCVLTKEEIDSLSSKTVKNG